MRLNKLEISNFRVIKQVELVFPDRVTGIIGPNGAGKSTLVEAIAWALYGNQAARSGRDEIKSQFAGRDQTCQVSLEFAVNDETYRVVRRLAGRSERAEVELYRGEASESVGVNETRQYVGQLLGLDWKGFLTSFLARQQELNALSDLQPSRRRDHLAGMLGIERLDKAISRIKEDTRLNAGKVAFMERQLVPSEQVLARIDELSEQLAALTSREAAYSSACKRADETLEQTTARFARLQEARSTWLQLTARMEAEEKAEASLAVQLENLRKEIAELCRSAEELKDLEKQVTVLKPSLDELERMKEARGRQLMKSDLSGQIEDCRREIERLSKQLSGNDTKLAALSATIGSVPDDVSDRHKDSEQKLHRARSEYSRLMANKEVLGKDIDKLERQLASVAEFGPDSVCDRCHRPLGDDLPRIREHLNGELAAMKKTARRQEALLQEKNDEGKRLNRLVSELAEKTRSRYEASVKRDALTREQESLRALRNQASQKCEKLSAQLAGLGEISFDQDRFDRLARKIDQLEQVRSKCDQLAGSLSRLPAAEKSAGETAGKIRLSQEAVRDLNEQCQRLDYSDAVFTVVQDELADSQRKAESARNELLAFSKELELTRKELEEKLKQRDSFEKAREELELCRTSRYYGEKLSGLIAEFRRHLIAGIRPALSDMSGRLITEMTNGRYGLVELDEKYNLRIMDNGQFFGVERFSGGEKDLANLCLRLAISLALTESAGLNRSFVILDEVFGSQDNERKDLIIKAMGNLKNRFPQIFLITHIEDIRDRVEELIEIVPTGHGYSEVHVNGALA